ncbi:MAG TPA: DUF2304 domain-containing protein [Thermoanaerobaculia bacterium]|nr:DUF2304 domain-containing protein [Thermoanaerobaculia bacterium]
MSGAKIQIAAVVVSVLLLLAVLELVRRRRLSEDYSFLWILFSLALLVLSLWRGLLHGVARWLGIFYPPALLLLVLIFFVFVASLYFSVVISRQREQIERLVEEQGILAAEVRELRAAAEGSTESPMAAATDDGGVTPRAG